MHRHMSSQTTVSLWYKCVCVCVRACVHYVCVHYVCALCVYCVCVEVGVSFKGCLSCL